MVLEKPGKRLQVQDLGEPSPASGQVLLAVKACGVCRTDLHIVPDGDLWEERTLGSVANLTRADGAAFMDLVRRVPVRTEVTAYRLQEANSALDDLRVGRYRGASVLSVS
jgi:alcohol dehydrogenase, propanol-preferring